MMLLNDIRDVCNPGYLEEGALSHRKGLCWTGEVVGKDLLDYKDSLKQSQGRAGRRLAVQSRDPRLEEDEQASAGGRGLHGVDGVSP